MATCRGCGKEIQFLRVRNDDGSVRLRKDGEPVLVPIDTDPPIYSLTEDQEGNPIAVRLRDAGVSHFATCPKANEFSGSRPKS